MFICKSRNYKKTQLLKTFPKIGKIVREIENPNIRELVYNNYRIISAPRIDILMIHHSARGLKKRIEE